MYTTCGVNSYPSDRKNDPHKRHLFYVLHIIMGTCSNQPFTSEQKTQIQGMVNATLQGTTSPQITDYVRNYADTQAEEGIGQLQQQYSTFGPAIARRSSLRPLCNPVGLMWLPKMRAAAAATFCARVNEPDIAYRIPRRLSPRPRR